MSQPSPRVEARPIRFQQTIPILRIFDLERAKEFYVEYLGFAVDWKHRFGRGLPLYMQISRGDFTIHLSEHHGDCTPGSTVFIIMSGLREFQREITAKRYRYLRPAIQRTAWNADVMEVLDPFGNRIRFNEYTRTPFEDRAEQAAGAKSSRGKRVHRKSSRSHA
jgi:catechol 2,3-dioxygenase-like lactoylglutathione lyase family enzyme